MTDMADAATGAGTPGRDAAPLDALFLAGGVGLGAYQLGVCRALYGAGVRPRWIAGGSIGAINGAILAGNPPELAIERLAEFWRRATTEVAPAAFDPFGWGMTGFWRHAASAANALQVLAGGNPALFRPRVVTAGGKTPSIHDLAPLEQMLAELVDFDRLNGGEVRFSLNATDVETSEPVLFDTAAGQRITPRHVLAGGGLLPLFEPLRIDGRLLGDAGFSANLPLGLLFGEMEGDAPLRCWAVDLYAPDGAPSATLEDAAARGIDMMYAGQSLRALREAARIWSTREALGAASRPAEVVYLSYRAPCDEAGPVKMFDFSRAALARREAAGTDDAAAALAGGGEVTAAGALRIRRVRRRAEQSGRAPH